MKLLLTIAELKDIQGVKQAILSGADLNAKDKFGSSALHIASANGLTEVAILLIESGIDVNIRSAVGCTILHYAAIYDQLAVATAALKYGADLTLEDKYGNQPLWAAVFEDKGRNSRIEMIKLFLKKGADINHKNKANRSPRDMLILADRHNLDSLFGI